MVFAFLDPRPGRSRAVRLAWLMVPACAFLGLLAFGLLSTGESLEPGDEAPSFEAPVLGEDSTIALSDYEGAPLVVNFWASWCEPCKEEAPLLNRAERIYGDDVEFLGVDIRDSLTDALAFSRASGMRYPSVRDESLDIYNDYGLTGQPETFFIDQDGVIVDHVSGPFTRADDLLSRIDLLARRDA